MRDFSDIFQYVGTREERHQVIVALEQLKQTKFVTKADSFDAVLHAEFSPELRAGIAGLCRIHSQSEVVTGLLKELHDAPAIVFTLAFVPSQEFVMRLVQKIRTISGNMRLIVSCAYEPAQVGGVCITYQGQFRDYSVRKKLGEYLEGYKTNPKSQ